MNLPRSEVFSLVKRLQHSKGIDISFDSGGELRLNDIKEGEIKVRDVAGVGVCMYVRIKNSLYKVAFTRA